MVIAYSIVDYIKTIIVILNNDDDDNIPTNNNCCAFECDCDGDECYVDGIPQEPMNGGDNDNEQETPPPSDGGGGFGGGFCFSGVTTVNVFDKDIIEMRDLEIGDRVQVDNNGYSRLYSFGHYNKDTMGDFFQINHTSSTEQYRPLELSKDDMIYVQNKESFVPASTITVGDKLLLAYNNNNAKKDR